MSSNLNAIFDQHLNSLNKDTRAKLLNLFKTDPSFIPRFDVSLRDQKEEAQQRLQKVCDLKTVSITDFFRDPENIFTTHELLGYCDGSLATKFTVQFNLFGGSVIGLGTKRHESLFPLIDSLKLVGCFCLTEVGYGNNAVQMETTAVYDENTKTFTINCPTVNSQKFWITNGAYYAHIAIVFAQTYVKGVNEGICAFLVKIRDEKLNALPGVVIDDMGRKMSSNGVDNARIILRNVKVDREALLNKLVDIEDNGTIKTNIKTKRQRFLRTADRLLSGRVCISSMMISSAKMALCVATKYASVRLSNGPTGLSDTPIGKFQIFNNQVIPLICKTFVFNMGLMFVRRVYCDYLLNPSKYSPEDFGNVNRLVCVIKPIICWHTNEVGNVCRERCGGQGFLSINIIEQVVGGAHAGITAEGDSSVLMQKVSNEYVADFARGIAKVPIGKYSKEELVKRECVADLDSLVSLMLAREAQLLAELTEKTVSKPEKEQIYQTWMMEESDLIQDLAYIFGERICLEECINKVRGQNEIIDNILAVFAGKSVLRHLGWYIYNGYISNSVAQRLPHAINDYIRKLSPHSLDICHAFGVPEQQLSAPMYTGYQEYYKRDYTQGEHNYKPKF